MKRKLCIIVLALCKWCTAWACFLSGDMPRDYKYYNAGIYHEYPVINRPSYVDANLKEWQRYTGQNISLEEIAQVVYKYSLTDMQQCMRNPQIQRCQNNAFAKYIFTDSAQYAAQLLLLAKQIEVAREVYNDPWYYPASRDENTFCQFKKKIYAMIMQVQHLPMHSQFFTERLMLQLVRVSFAQRKYEECIKIWEYDVQHWPTTSLMRTMIKSYVAGAYAQIGEKDKASTFFLELENYRALADITFTSEKRYTDFIRKVYDYKPDCAEIVAPILQSDLQEVGQERIRAISDSATCKQYYDVMQYIIRTRKSKNMWLWYYTAAFLEDQMGQAQKAAKTIRLAMQYPASKEAKDNIRMMRIYLDAKTRSYDAQYEQELYADLRWIDQVIKADTARLRSIWVEGEMDEWTVWYNISCTREGKYLCYPYTMLRKIILSEVVPRMNHVGKTQQAIALSNYADNMLLTILAPEKRHCFFNGFFMTMDTASARDAERYVVRALNPQTQMDKLLVSGSYIDKDYLYDIVGTLYLRERNYKKAMEVLSRVEPTYQLRLNTHYYLQSDPFALDRTSTYSGSVDCKYKFACEMYSLQQVFQNEKIDSNRRANALLNFAIGMRNSYINMWALTQYSQGYHFIPGHQSWLTKEREKEVNKEYDRLVEKTFGMFTNDEVSAAAYLKYRNNYTIVTKYPNTEVAEYIRTTCDTYYDYYPIYTPKKEDYETNY